MAIYLDEITQGLPGAVGVPLGASQLVKLTIIARPDGLVAETGEVLEQTISIDFITEASPMYSDVDSVILRGGPWLEEIPEAAIYSMIYGASTLVDDFVLIDINDRFPDRTTRGWKFFNRARTEFVQCKTVADLLRSIVSGKGTNIGRKLLADFSVDNSAMAGVMSQIRPILQDHVNCYLYWQKVLLAGGAVDFESPMAKTAVKGSNIPDGFGGIGRGWVADSDNLKYREPDSGGTSRPRRYGDRNPMTDWHES